MTKYSFYINTIYPGIEGEGIFLGTPTMFLRLQGCSVACVWCDSKETWDKDGGKSFSIEELINELEAKRQGIKRLLITGGSPLESVNLNYLIDALRKEEWEIHLECSGQYYNEQVFSLVDFISCDFKTPSSGVTAREDLLEQLICLYPLKLQIKAPVLDKKDLLAYIGFAERMYDKYPAFENYIITPVWNKGVSLKGANLEEFQELLYNINPPIRLIFQQHKFIWGDNEKNR